MRPHNPTGLLATLTAGLLVFAMVLGAFADDRRFVSIEHSHEASHHGHDEHHEDSGHEHPSEGSQDNQAPGEDTHHHHLTMQVSPAIFTPDTSLWISFSAILGYSGLPRSLPCPDGPYFELIKPPQIG